MLCHNGQLNEKRAPPSSLVSQLTVKDVPVDVFSSRSQTIREAAGPDASAKSRDVAALDTRQAKAWADPELVVTNPLSTSAPTLIGSMFGAFNSIIAVLAVVWFMFIGIRHVVRSGHQAISARNAAPSFPDGASLVSE